MQSSGIPTKFGLAFAANAAGAYKRTVPQSSQIGIQAGAASFNDGFPPVCFLPITGGGTAPFGQDFNGLLNAITLWSQWQQAGGPVPYDSAFATAIGGYPKGAVLAAVGVNGYCWLNTIDNNVSNPDTGGGGWLPLNFAGSMTTGDVKLSFKNTADAGFIMMNDGSIGNGSSGATTLASALTSSLFTVLYNNITDTWAPIQTSGGGATTRGAQGSAATAYANNCRLVLPKALGRALAISGAGLGLTSRALGQNFGEENHTLVTSEAPTGISTLNDPGHTHTINDPTHNHAITDPGHGHTINDPQHNHSTTADDNTNISTGVNGGNAGGFSLWNTGTPAHPITSTSSSTGISNNGNTTGISINTHSTGVSNNANTTGVSLTDHGGNAGHNNMQPSAFLNAMIAL